MANPKWMDELALLVVLTGVIAIISSNVIAWIIFTVLTFIAGIALIIVDRKQRSIK